MKNISTTEARNINGGKRYYSCIFCGYTDTNYWKVYANTVRCAYKRGWFDIPLWMIKTGFGM